MTNDIQTTFNTNIKNNVFSEFKSFGACIDHVCGSNTQYCLVKTFNEHMMPPLILVIILMVNIQRAILHSIKNSHKKEKTSKKLIQYNPNKFLQ